MAKSQRKHLEEMRQLCRIEKAIVDDQRAQVLLPFEDFVQKTDRPFTSEIARLNVISVIELALMIP